MGLIADILLGAGAFAAAIYCMILARRLNRLSGLDQDLGGAIAVLSNQVDEMTQVLEKSKETARESAGKLENLTGRAEEVAGRLEVLLAALHDVSPQGDIPQPEPAKPAGSAKERPLELTPDLAPEPEPETASEAEPETTVFVRARERREATAGAA